MGVGRSVPPRDRMFGGRREELAWKNDSMPLDFISPSRSSDRATNRIAPTPKHHRPPSSLLCVQFLVWHETTDRAELPKIA